jgi:hypothetical protein
MPQGYRVLTFAQWETAQATISHVPLRAGIKSHTLCESIVHLSYEQITHLGYVFWPPRYYNLVIVKPGAL